MKRLLFLLLVLVFGFAPSAFAYSPPPGGTLFFRPRNHFVIKLPPRAVFNPDRFRFAGVNYVINGTTVTRADGAANDGKVSVSVANAGGATEDDSYIISLNNLTREESASVKDLRLTFRKPVAGTTISSLENYVKNNPLANAYLSDSNCVTGAQSHICFVTEASLRTIHGAVNPVYLKQVLPLKSVVIGGNVAGEVLQNFAIQGDAIAVGDTVNITGGQNVNSYFSNSKLRWGNGTNDGLVGQKMEELYAKRTRGSTVTDRTIGQNGSTAAFPGTSGPCNNTPTWNLNSTDVRLACSGQSTSLSSPPEGKLWNIERANGSTGTFEIGRLGGSPVTFSGSGTLVFGGDIYINAPIHCAPGTRLGIITRGNIVFRTGTVQCGAFVTLGGSSYYTRNGDIRLDDPNTFIATSGTLKAIMVAKGNITLPKNDTLTNTYQINYDSNFANNPTILFRELLTIVKENLS